MSEEVLVSIVVPVYNSEKYLEACLDSIVNQSYKNIEIILVDDGSTDGSAEIVDLYATRDERVKVIHNKNHGVSYSRNYGIRMATGSKVLFIDSDDTIDLDYVKKLVTPLSNENYDLVICGINDISVKKNRVRPRKFPEKLTGNLREDFRALFMMPIVTGPVTKLYDVEIIRENEVYFSEDISFNEDVMFNLAYLRYVKKYAIVRESLYNYYRRADSSLSKNRSEKNFNSVLNVANDLKRFVMDKNIVDGDVALTHQCLNYLKWFAVTDSGYSLFKARTAKIRDILDGMYATNGNKRTFNVWLLKNDMTCVLYVMYWFREKFEL